MHAFPGSVSDEGLTPFPLSDDTAERACRVDGDSVLIAGVNWLGDSVITMPAIQAYRRANPGIRLVMLVKPKCRSLWSMHAAIDEVLICPETVSGAVHALGVVRGRKFGSAFILPLSFRSALVPFLARIPRRTGLPGHLRDWMLTRVVNPQLGPGRTHQCYEYMHVFGVPDAAPDQPRLTVPDEVLTQVRSRLWHDGVMMIGLLPGAAYGPSKRWPADYFAETGRMLKDTFKCSILVLGSASERELCGRIAGAIGQSAVDLSGQTTIPELAATLSVCALVIANDSGGMHLAAAVGTPVVAVFGITDPARTGPLGKHVCVLQDSPVRSRELDRESEIAAMSLSRISREQVFEAACRLLDS